MSGCGSGRLSSSRLVQLTERRAKSDDVAFLVSAPDEYAAGCRGHLDRYLIRFELDDGFPGCYRFTLPLQPTGDGGLYDRLTEWRNFDRDHAGKFDFGNMATHRATRE